MCTRLILLPINIMFVSTNRVLIHFRVNNEVRSCPTCPDTPGVLRYPRSKGTIDDQEYGIGAEEAGSYFKM